MTTLPDRRDHVRAKGSLLAILGVAFGVAAGVGNAIGSGILRTPGVVAGYLPSAAWIVGLYVAGAVYCALLANVVSELSTMMPRAGGPYVFIRRAYGEFAGFVFGWADWALQISSIAFASIALGEYVLHLWPRLPVGAVSLSVVTIAVLGALNLLGLRVGSGMQQVLSLAKVAGLLAVVAACLFMPVAAPDSQPSAETVASLTGIALLVAFFRSWQIVQENYAGFDGAVYFSEENRDSSRDIPRSLFLSLAVTAVVYLSIIVAITHVLAPPTIAGSRLPLADAASVTMGPTAGSVVHAVSIVSLLGILNVTVLFTPRILFAIGRDGLFDPRSATVNAGGTPAVATVVTCLAAMLLASTGSFELLYTITAFIGVTISITYITGFFVLRRRAPDAARPYRARGYPWLPGLALALAAVLWLGSLFANPASAAWSLALVAIAYPVYRFAVARRRIREGHALAAANVPRA